MAALRHMIAGLLLITLPVGALADQTDPRLGDLFDELRAAPTEAEAAAAEEAIWSIWLEVPDPEATALMAHGVSAMGRGDTETAIALFDELVELRPDYAEAWNKRATAHYLANQFEQSLDDIARTLELEPRHFGALSGRGLVYVQLDNLESALDSFEAALAVHPHLAGAATNAEALRDILGQREI